jgi:hypothetical protein
MRRLVRSDSRTVAISKRAMFDSFREGKHLVPVDYTSVEKDQRELRPESPLTVQNLTLTPTEIDV